MRIGDNRPGEFAQDRLSQVIQVHLISLKMVQAEKGVEEMEEAEGNDESSTPHPDLGARSNGFPKAWRFGTSLLDSWS